jgi:hypothetical protein
MNIKRGVLISQSQLLKPDLGICNRGSNVSNVCKSLQFCSISLPDILNKIIFDHKLIIVIKLLNFH